MILLSKFIGGGHPTNTLLACMVIVESNGCCLHVWLFVVVITFDVEQFCLTEH
jgi:hypothetical protein